MHSNGVFAYSALQQTFIVPGACLKDNTNDVPAVGTLNSLTRKIHGANQTLNFSIPAELDPRSEPRSCQPRELTHHPDNQERNQKNGTDNVLGQVHVYHEYLKLVESVYHRCS